MESYQGSFSVFSTYDMEMILNTSKDLLPIISILHACGGDLQIHQTNTMN